MSSGDIKLSLVNGKYDFDFGSDGDFIQDEGLDTAILMSLFCDERADESEVPLINKRSGYWAIDITDMKFSKLWLVGGRKTQDKLNQGIEYCNESLQWLIDDELAIDIQTVASFTSNGIKLDISITKVNGIIEGKVFDLYLNTTY